MQRQQILKKYLLHLFTLTIVIMLGWQASRVHAACDVPAFQLGNFYDGPPYPSRAVVRDFNGDGKLDLATNGGINSVYIFLGNGAGGFAPSVAYPVGLTVTKLESADFNSDGKLDLAVFSLSGSSPDYQVDVSILNGDGMGGFGAATTYNVSTIGFSDYIAIADFNGDSKPDVAVTVSRPQGQSVITVLLNNGAGVFITPMHSNLGTDNASHIVAGDFNSDGKQDAAIASGVSVLLVAGNGIGGFGPPVTVTQAPFGAIALAAADFNADGKLDLVVSWNTSHSRVLLNDGIGNFTSVIVIAIGHSLAIGDFNGDGKQDVIIGHQVFLGNGAGGFINGGTVTPTHPGSDNYRVYGGDFNNDGRRDVVIITNKVTVYPNLCGELFSPSDYDGDGKADAVVWRPSNGNWLYRRSSSGVVETVQWGLGSLGDIPVPGNYDSDIKTDIAVFRPSNGTWYIRNSSDNSFRAVQWGLVGDKPVPADYDGDRLTDIAVFRPTDGNWYVLLSSNNSFVAYNFGISEDRPVPADYDGDDKADIAVFRPSNGYWYIQRSSDNAFLYYNWGLSTDVPVPADYNGDGRAEIAVYRHSINNWITREANGEAFFFPSNMTGNSIVPQPADYDGNGRMDRVAWRPSDGFWYEPLSLSAQFFHGSTGDIPVTSLFGRNQ